MEEEAAGPLGPGGVAPCCWRWPVGLNPGLVLQSSGLRGSWPPIVCSSHFHIVAMTNLFLHKGAFTLPPPLFLLYPVASGTVLSIVTLSIGQLQ